MSLLDRLIEKGGVILPKESCSERVIEYAQTNNAYYDDGNGNGCVHLTISELEDFGGGIKNPNR
jgi:hypothetical protein